MVWNHIFVSLFAISHSVLKAGGGGGGVWSENIFMSKLKKKETAFSGLCFAYPTWKAAGRPVYADMI